MSNQLKAGLAGGVAGALTAIIAIVALAAAVWLVEPGAIFAQTSHVGPSHEQMHQMMDAMHGPGTSQRMHDSMGPDGEKMMDQCVAMTGMTDMMGSMQGGGMQGMAPMMGR